MQTRWVNAELLEFGWLALAMGTLMGLGWNMEGVGGNFVYSFALTAENKNCALLPWCEKNGDAAIPTLPM